MAKNALSVILTCLVIFVNLVILNTLFVILSRRRSIHKFKAHLKFLWIFRLFVKGSNDKCLRFFVIAQNDSSGEIFRSFHSLKTTKSL